MDAGPKVEDSMVSDLCLSVIKLVCGSTVSVFDCLSDNLNVLFDLAIQSIQASGYQASLIH